MKINKMEELSVIIPVHKYDENIATYLTRAIESVNEQDEKCGEIIFVGPKNVLGEITIENAKITKLENKGETDYCSQINLAVKNTKTKYFTILELDDYFSKTWFKNVKSYLEYNPNYTAFLPIVGLSNTEGKELGTINELVWARAFSEELGAIDAGALESCFDFVTTGGVFRVDEFIECGMLKPSIKLSFWYEYLLRAVENGTKFFVIPKIGYTHILDREDSLMQSYKDMDEQERLWWIKLAKKEYFFKKDRIEKSLYVKE